MRRVRGRIGGLYQAGSRGRLPRPAPILSAQSDMLKVNWVGGRNALTHSDISRGNTLLQFEKGNNHG